MNDRLIWLERQELKAKIRLNSLKKAREDYWGSRNQNTPFSLLIALETAAKEELKQWEQEIESFKKNQA